MVWCLYQTASSSFLHLKWIQRPEAPLDRVEPTSPPSWHRFLSPDRAPTGRPGFLPIQGLEASESTQPSLVGVLETAMKLANQDEGPEDEEDEEPKKV